jgi:hypothetical protein
MVYRYRFTTREERRASGAWWHRELVGGYHRPLSGPQSAAPADPAPDPPPG